MDVLSSLTTVGKYMNKNAKKRYDKINTRRIKRTRINGENTYNSRNIRNYRRHLKSLANKNYKLAKNPEKTGVIPNFYNLAKDVKKRKIKKKDNLVESFDDDSVFSDDGSLYSNESKGSCKSLNMTDHTAFFKKGNMISDNKRHLRKFINKSKVEDGPGYLSQFHDLCYDNPGDPVSSNNVHHKTGKFGNIRRLETERNLALKGEYSNFDNTDMTYGVTSKENFVHNNMVPFFKNGFGKGYGPNSIFQKKLDDVKQRKMERFTGSVKNLEYRPKTERRPLFNPHKGLTWIYGMPNFTNYFESRYIPGRERRNEYLHQPVNYSST